MAEENKEETQKEEVKAGSEASEQKAEETQKSEQPQNNEQKTEEKKESSEEGTEIGAWEPKTELGRKVKNGEIRDIDKVIDENMKILEPEVVDSLVETKTELLSIGQSKGKFGGGSRRAWRQTQRKTREGSVPKFSAMAVVGDEKGHIGVGRGEATETLPARDKALRKAKLNMTRVERKCSAFECLCSEKHSVPFRVKGRSGGVRVELRPAPQGTGLVVADELKKVLRIAGVEDVYSKTFGSTRTTFNLVKACMNALEKTRRR